MSPPRDDGPLSVRRRCQDLCLAAGLRLVGTLVRGFPEFLAFPAARFLGRTWFRLARRDARTAIQQLQATLPLSSRRDAHRMARHVFERLAEEAALLLRLDTSRGKAPGTIRIEGQAYLDTALAQRRGVVWMSGHIGNWELMAIEVARRGYPLHVVVDAIRYPRLERLVRRFRSRHGVHALVRGRDTTRDALVRVLAQGRILGLLVDQRSHTRGVVVPFLGRPAHTPVVPALLALETGAPIIVGVMERTAGRRYRIRIMPPVEAPEWGSLEDRAEAVMARVNALLSSVIRSDPTAWPWFHKRWPAQVKQGE